MIIALLIIVIISLLLNVYLYFKVSNLQTDMYILQKSFEIYVIEKGANERGITKEEFKKHIENEMNSYSDN